MKPATIKPGKKYNHLKTVLAKIVPSPQEKQQLARNIDVFLGKLNTQLVDAKAILGGSGAKDTWLAGHFDVDVFVQFEFKKYADRSQELSLLLELFLQKAFTKEKIIKLHGSRDYFQVAFDNLIFEVIPILKIINAKDAKNITDVSPLHSAWVNSHSVSLKDEIRLAKQFLRAHRIYGAESYLSGISGYVTEILVIYYGSFEKFLKAAMGWKVGEIIDVEKHYPKKDALFHLNRSKTRSPLIVIDPVDKSRNAAAALSLEKFVLLQKIAKEYLKHPDASFFEYKMVDLASLQQEAKEKKQHLAFIVVDVLEGKEDVIGTKLVKLLHFIEEKLASFGVTKTGWEWDKGLVAKLYFIIAQKELPAVAIRQGPPLKIADHVERFKKEHQDTFVKEGKIYARVVVKYPRLEDCLKAALDERYAQEKITKVQELLVI